LDIFGNIGLRLEIFGVLVSYTTYSTPIDTKNGAEVFWFLIVLSSQISASQHEVAQNSRSFKNLFTSPL